MAEGDNVFAGLNKNGLIVFIVLLLVCLPLCWLPWVIDSLKAAPAGGGEAPVPGTEGEESENDQAEAEDKRGE